MCRVIFANLLNELMISAPFEAYATALNAVSPRKMWLAKNGDVIVTPRPIDEAFKQYVCGILGLSADEIITIAPPGAATDYLAHSARRAGLAEKLASILPKNKRREFLGFALDRPTLDLVKELSISLHEYATHPTDSVVSQIYDLNTKSGFRRKAQELGMQTVPGETCEGLEPLIQAIHRVSTTTGGVIVKYDRSSNGFGHLLLPRREPSIESLRARLSAHIARFPEQPLRFTVEALMPFLHVPSVEMVVEEAGPRLLYVCDQRCRNASFSGMVTPPINLPPDAETELKAAGWRFGSYLHALGHRGVFDVDGGLDEQGVLYVTETNLRRTGGTYLDTLMRRLIGDDYLSTHVWWADARITGPCEDFFEGWSGLCSAGIAFKAERRTGVLLTANTLEIDHKWRYLIIAKNATEADGLERQLERVLNLPEVPNVAK